MGWLLIVPAVLVLFVVLAALSQGDVDASPTPTFPRPPLAMPETMSETVADPLSGAIATDVSARAAAPSTASIVSTADVAAPSLEPDHPVTPAGSAPQPAQPPSWVDLREDIVSVWSRCAESAASDPAQLAVMSEDVVTLMRSLVRAAATSQTTSDPAPSTPVEPSSRTTASPSVSGAG